MTTQERNQGRFGDFPLLFTIIVGADGELGCAPTEVKHKDVYFLSIKLVLERHNGSKRLLNGHNLTFYAASLARLLSLFSLLPVPRSRYSNDTVLHYLVYFLNFFFSMLDDVFHHHRWQC